MKRAYYPFVRVDVKKLLSVLFLVYCFADFAQAAPGDLDLSFSGDGKVTTAVSSSFAKDVAIQSDGKIVVAGRGGNDVAVFRYNSDGTLDTTFSGDGKVATDVSGTIDGAGGVAIQSDGKIVVAGTSGSGLSQSIFLIRYNSNGSLDTTFSGDGIVTIDGSERSDSTSAVAIQSSGKIVVAGIGATQTPDDFDIILLRLNSNGTLDTTFSGDGIVVTDLGGFETTFDVAIAALNKIVVAGEINGGANIFLARYNSDGVLDNTFGAGGASIIDLDGSARALAIQSDDKIVVAGAASPGVTLDFHLFRSNSDGTIDNTFGGGDGVVITHVSGHAHATAVAIQAEGKILAAVSTGLLFDPPVTASSEFAIVRYNSNGTLDATFSGDGIVITDFSSNSLDSANAMAIQKNNGRIVVAGISSDGFALARYHAFDCNGSNVTILGTQVADSINGTTKNDVIHGLGGKDTINGNDGNDILCGGDGNDGINGGIGDDTLLGQNNDDSLDGGSGTDGCSVGGSSFPPTALQSSINCETLVTSGSGISGVWLGDVTQTCNESDEDLICTLEGIIEVENPGTETAPISTLRFFLSFDEFLDEDDILVDETQVDFLDPKEMEEVSLLGIVPPGEDVIGQFIVALLDAEDVVREVNEDNNVVVSAAIVGEGSDGGVSSSGCSIAQSATPKSILLYLLIPVFIVIRRLWKGYRIN